MILETHSRDQTAVGMSSPTADGGNPFLSDTVFSLMITHLRDAYNDIKVGVEFSPFGILKKMTDMRNSILS